MSLGWSFNFSICRTPGLQACPWWCPRSVSIFLILVPELFPFLRTIYGAPIAPGKIFGRHLKPAFDIHTHLPSFA